MNKKILVPVIVVVVLALAAGAFFAFRPKASKTTTQTATVKRGNLVITIPATGNLAFSQTADLAFSTAGTVQDVLVQPGDPVTNGEVVATLDPAAWQTNIANLERNLTQAQINVINAQSTLDKSQGTYTGQDLEAAQSAVNGDLAYLQYALDQQAKATPDTQSVWASVVARAKATLSADQAKVDAIMGVADSPQVQINKLNLQMAQGKLQDAQTALDNANATSPEVKATFDGFVTKVNVAAGDAVNSGAIAVSIADPNKYEVSVLVSELDVFNIKIGGTATVQASALPSVPLRGTIMAVSPTATISSGVVNYQVTLDVQMAQSARTAQTGTGSRSSQSGQTNQAGTAMTAPTVSLKQGLTVTVNILEDQRNNVLLIPNRAISKQGKNSTVQVLVNGVAETKTIQTGVSDLSNTEVTSGLSEGDVVVLPQSTSSSSSTQQRGGLGGGGFLFRG